MRGRLPSSAAFSGRWKCLAGLGGAAAYGCGGVVQFVGQACGHGAERDQLAVLRISHLRSPSRHWWTNWMAIAPSPTAEAQRLTEP